MFSIKLNAKDINRIKSRLNRTITSAQKKGSAVFNYRLALLNDYKETIVNAMGEVYGADGGSPDTDPFLGRKLSVSWEPLSNRTLADKKASGWSLYIWEATGETKDAVKVYETTGFVGIDGNKNPSAFEKALQTEFGGALSESGPSDYSKRALFTIANSIFNENREHIKKAIVQKVIETARQQGWGR